MLGDDDVGGPLRSAEVLAILGRQRGEHLRRRNGWQLLGLRCSTVLAATLARTRGPLATRL
jgi:hypothetical protein